jgi:hypothetical protein
MIAPEGTEDAEDEQGNPQDVPRLLQDGGIRGRCASRRFAGRRVDLDRGRIALHIKVDRRHERADRLRGLWLGHRQCVPRHADDAAQQARPGVSLMGLDLT